MAQWVRSLDHTSLSPILRGCAPSLVNYKKGCTRLAAASDKVFQLLAQGQWFSPGTPASSTTKTGHHDIAEILLKVALNTKIQIQIQIHKKLHLTYKKCVLDAIKANRRNQTFISRISNCIIYLEQIQYINAFVLCDSGVTYTIRFL